MSSKQTDKTLKPKLARIPLAMTLLVLVTVGAFSAGCGNIGNGAPGASADEMKADFDKKPLDERAKILMSLPGPLEDKQQKVKDMYKAAGQEAPADVLNPAPAGAPGAKPAGH